METTINEALQQVLSPEQLLQPREGNLETLSPSSKDSWERCDPASIEVPQSDIDKFISDYQRKEAGKVNHVRYLAHLRKLETQSLYTAEELLYWIQHKQGVQIDKYNDQIVQGLCLYFTRDERFEEWFDEPTSLQKGILLMGNVGCGKTFLMKAFQFNPRAAYAVKPCRTVADEYKQDGIAGIRRHSSLVELSEQNPFTKSTLAGWCFDDLGTEEASNHFGDKRNVMEQVLLGCYDRSELRGRIHTTTNLTETEIVEKYGLRVRSRMNEMFNIIEFPVDAVDRRK